MVNLLSIVGSLSVVEANKLPPREGLLEVELACVNPTITAFSNRHTLTIAEPVDC